jgi:hypothetical protein
MTTIRPGSFNAASRTHSVPGFLSTTAPCNSPSARRPDTAMDVQVRSGLTSTANTGPCGTVEASSARDSHRSGSMTVLKRSSGKTGISGHWFRYARQKASMPSWPLRCARSHSPRMKSSVIVMPSAGIHAHHVAGSAGSASSGAEYSM